MGFREANGHGRGVARSGLMLGPSIGGSGGYLAAVADVEGRGFGQRARSSRYNTATRLLPSWSAVLDKAKAVGQGQAQGRFEDSKNKMLAALNLGALDQEYKERGPRDDAMRCLRNSGVVVYDQAVSTIYFVDLERIEEVAEAIKRGENLADRTPAQVRERALALCTKYGIRVPESLRPVIEVKPPSQDEAVDESTKVAHETPGEEDSTAGSSGDPTHDVFEVGLLRNKALVGALSDEELNEKGELLEAIKTRIEEERVAIEAELARRAELALDKKRQDLGLAMAASQVMLDLATRTVEDTSTRVEEMRRLLAEAELLLTEQEGQVDEQQSELGRLQAELDKLG